MTVDLRSDRPGGTWVRRSGDHEGAGVAVSVGNTSAHVTLADLGIMFAIDREDVPSAWESPIDVVKIRSEVVAAIGKNMSTTVLKELIAAIREQRQRAYWQGEQDVRSKIREALEL